MPEDAIKISNSTLKTDLGLDGTRNGNPEKRIDSIRAMQRFTASEIAAYSKALYVTPDTRNPNLQSSGIISYLKPIHQKIGNKKVQVDKMKALAPEIDQSRILVSSSIMSPNDLQDGEFIFSFDDVPALANDPQLSEQIAEVFDQFFNKMLQLGIKSYDWIGDVQYSSGCRPILILPIATQLDLRHRTADDVRKDMRDANMTFPFADGGTGPGMASFSQFAKSLDRDEDYLYSGSSGKKITWQSVFEESTPAQELRQMIPSMESFGVTVPTPFRPKTANRRAYDNIYDKEYVVGLEDMIVNLRTRLQEGDVIRVSENPEILRFNTEKKLLTKEELMQKIKKKYAGGYDPRYIIREEIVDLKPNSSKFKHTGHPTIIELPPESVIPIHIPGAPQEHLGYFVLIDDHGQPLTIENSGMLNEDTSCSNGGQVNAAYEAIFGQGCCGHSYFNKTGAVEAAGTMIFNHLLDKYLRSRISGVFGRNDLEISRFNAIATTLFFRLLDRKETTLVFVPPELLHYFAFDYDKEDGTGVSKLNDIQFLLSLRTTYVVASIIAMANDAVQQKVVNIGVDDKNANLEALMDMVTQVFIAKQKVNGSLDPSEIIRDLYSNSLCIVPKNVPGLSDFSVEVQNNSGQSVRPDNDLIEQLTNLLVSHLDVPPAALNQLAEPEYAKSLVTYNLFFAKKITRYQRIWCSHIQEFVKDYAMFSEPFQKALLKKLSANVKVTTHTKDDLPNKAKKLMRKNPNQYSDNKLSTMVMDIISGVHVTLPTPNIVVDTSQFEQLSTYTRNVNELADMFYPQDLIPSDDQAASTALPIMKAMWKRKQLSKFISQIGSFTMTDIPDTDEIDPTEYTDLFQSLQNLNSAITRQREAIGNAGQEESGFGGDGGFGGGDSFGGDDMGGDFGGDMGGDMGGGDDFGSDMPAMPEMPDMSSEGGEEPTMMAKYLTSLTKKK